MLYALGSLIALVSFALVAFYLLFFERERRRFYGTPVVEDEEDDGRMRLPVTVQRGGN